MNKDMNKEFAKIRQLMESIEANQTDFGTRSKYMSDGFFAQYVVLLPAPNGGGVVMNAYCNLELWGDQMREYTPQDLTIQAYTKYSDALHSYEETDL
jgi:hypothetical protein